MVENCPELEPVCCKKRQKKVQTKKLFWAIGDFVEVLIGIRLIINVHLELIWYLSEPLFLLPKT